MTIFPMLAVSFIMNVVAVLFVISCVALVLIILVQKGRGGGLSGAFGGGMASGILGSKTGDFLTWVTIVLVSIFLLLAVVMAKYYKPSGASDYDVSPPTQQQPVESTGQPEPSNAAGETAGQTGAGQDTNSPGS
jgi:preprotein translocase subunit SecG